MRRILIYDNHTVESDCAEAVCREIRMRDTLISCVVCGCTNDRDRKRFLELGFVCAEESTPEAELSRAACEDRIDGVDLVTADDTIGSAIQKARLCGKEVRVFGEAQAASFIRRCDRFCYLDVLRGRKGNCLTPLADIVSDSYQLIITAREQNGALPLSELHAGLVRLHPEYDARNYGYAGLLELLSKNAPDIRTYRENGCTYLEYADDRDRVESFITTYLAEHGNEVEDMQELLDALTAAFDRFDTRLYGYTSDIAFFLSFPKLEIINNKGVKLKKVFKLKENAPLTSGVSDSETV